MVGTKMHLLLDENSTENRQNQVKKLTVPSNEVTTKRAAFGDLQNRGVTRNIPAKEAAQKDLKDVKPANTIRNAKSRIDTHWKKQPLGTNNAATSKPTTASNVPLLRSNSVRVNTATVATTTLARQISSTVLPIKAESDANNKLTVKPKPGTDGQANNLAAAVPTLRREDSNLASKSLSKLRAALAKPAATKATAVAAVQKKEIKREVVAAKKETASTNAVAKLPIVRPVATVATTVTTTTTAAVSLSSKRLLAVEDIDADDGANLVLVSEYVNDIYDYLYQVEEQQPIYEDHLAGQLEMSPRMRAVLIDWINEVHLQFHLTAETFQLAVAIIDRYLQLVKNTKRGYLQLVGVSALFIASKYEELYPPAIVDFVYITDDTYTAKQIRMMELQIFKTIDCNLSRPLPIHFLRRFSKAASAEDAHHGMSKYFLELSSLEYALSSYKPSEIAAASLFLSLHLLNDNSRNPTGFNDKHWTPTLEFYSRYTATELRPIAKQIARIARDAKQAKLRSVFNKYQSTKFQKISLRPELYSPLMASIAGKK